MNSLLEKEGMAGKVQMIYIDPPYGIRYGSNFQPFVNRRDVKDGKDEDLTQEPETLKAFRDTWELGIHSYLTYLRDRLLLARDLLHESGSVFVQISDENLHHVMEVMHETFGGENFLSVISIRKTTSQGTASYLGATTDFVIWYARDRSKIKYRQLYVPRSADADERYDQALALDGSVVSAANADSAIDRSDLRLFQLDNLTSSRPSGEGDVTAFEFQGKVFSPGKGTFKSHSHGLSRLAYAGRLQATGIAGGGTLRYRRFKDDFPIAAIGNLWYDISGSVQSRSDPKVYVVQSSTSILQRCLLMTTDPGDVVLDPTCGSGTTAFVAEQWGRRWITCDTSRVAVTLAKQRLMTAVFDYYTLANPKQGVGAGFKYKTVPHVTLKSIANNPEIVEGMTREQIDAAIKKYADQETLYDQPEVDRSKARVTGPFTYEAVPAINVRPIDDLDSIGPIADPMPADLSIARSGVTIRQDEWRDELARTGVRGKGGAKLEFARMEPLPGTRYLHAIGETKDKQARTVAVSFGPEFAPLEQRHVELAWEEARNLSPRPEVLLFAAFHFDPEAAKDIDELDPKKTGMQFLKLQMNKDLLTDDLKKKRSSNESFWLVGQPDVTLRKIHRGQDTGLWEVEVHGFDYYNPTNGKVESGDTSKIAMWLLDTDYDGRSLLPRQVFFPMSGEKDGWSRLAKNLKAEIDEDLIEAYRGTVSLPFDLGKNRRIAAKIIDDRGIECLKIINVER
jgi:adenine-specific DNA-methyltransferase